MEKTFYEKNTQKQGAKWINILEDSTHFHIDINHDTKKVVLSKFSSVSAVRILYKVEGEITTDKRGYSLFFDNHMLSGTLTKTNPSPLLTGSMMEINKKISFFLERVNE